MQRGCDPERRQRQRHERLEPDLPAQRHGPPGMFPCPVEVLARVREEIAEKRMGGNEQVREPGGLDLGDGCSSCTRPSATERPAMVRMPAYMVARAWHSPSPICSVSAIASLESVHTCSLRALPAKNPHQGWRGTGWWHYGAGGGVRS